MGNTDTKLAFRKAVVHLTTKTQPVEASDEVFWGQFWSETVNCVQDVFALIPAAEIRALREESPSNLATLCYKAVEKLVEAAETGCHSHKQEQTVLNCVRLLTRILAYIFEDPDWRGFFWSTLPRQSAEDSNENESVPLAQSLLTALCDLLFCPDFTVATTKKSGPDNPEDMSSIDSCEYIWEAGVGFTHSPPTNATYDHNRTELLKLLLTCFSETMYLPPVPEAHGRPNQWIQYFTSTDNRHALPLFTSLLNVVCAYDPVGYGMPYNHLMFTDSREPLVEVAIHVLCATLESSEVTVAPSEVIAGTVNVKPTGELEGSENLFVNYLSRIHREEDFAFILKGLTRLLNNPLMQTYLPGSCKRIQFHQELLIFFWKMCDINKKFMFYVLKSSDVLDVLVPILYFLNDARSDQSRVGLMHIGVFILLLLSGERNFGVRLNKPYAVRVPMDIPVFTGSHADFLIIVFHKIITTGHQRLQPLFDCLLTIIVNVSPYLKSLSMVASTKLLHLLEAFSTPWFLYASPTNHHLVFFLLEVFNNIIQYQFDGNSNLVYTIIRKRAVFHQLANLPTDHSSIAKALTKRGGKGKNVKPTANYDDAPSMEGSIPAAQAEPGTLQATLAATPVVTSTGDWSGSLSYQGQSSRSHGHRSVISLDLFDQEFEFEVQNMPPRLESMFLSSGDPWSTSLSHSFVDAKSTLPPSKTLSSMLPAETAVNRLIADIRCRTKLTAVSEPKLTELNILTDDDKERHLLQSWNCKPPPPKPLVQLAVESRQHCKVNQMSDVKLQLARMLGIDKMTEKSPASSVHQAGASSDMKSFDDGDASGTESHAFVADRSTWAEDGNNGPGENNVPVQRQQLAGKSEAIESELAATLSDTESSEQHPPSTTVTPAAMTKAVTQSLTPSSPTGSVQSSSSVLSGEQSVKRTPSLTSSSVGWVATPEWVHSWKQKLPLQTIMRLLQVLVPQVEKICIDKGLTDESEILKFLQHGTLVGLLPVPHPILIRKYQANSGTTMWFRTYMWGVIYLRNVDPPIWYDTDVKLFEIQRV